MVSSPRLHDGYIKIALSYNIYITNEFVTASKQFLKFILNLSWWNTLRMSNSYGFDVHMIFLEHYKHGLFLTALAIRHFHSLVV